MQIALLSDTHSRHARIRIPTTAGLVLHAGDFTRRGRRAEVVAFLDWLARWPCPRVLVAGNHDYYAEEEPRQVAALCRERDIHYLVGQGVRVGGLHIWGGPWSPRFCDMAFNVDRGAPLAEKWARIPDKLDVLLTHTPPMGRLDRIMAGRRVGCEALAEAVAQKAPRLHVFGHIHEAAGEEVVGPTRFVNAARCRLVAGVRPAVLVELAPRG